MRALTQQTRGVSMNCSSKGANTSFSIFTQSRDLFYQIKKEKGGGKRCDPSQEAAGFFSSTHFG